MIQSKCNLVVTGLIVCLVGLGLSSKHSPIQICLNGLFAIISFSISIKAIPKFKDKFFTARLVGYDHGKSEKKLIPESMGVVVGAVFLINMFLFIPVFFTHVITVPGSFYPQFNLSEKVFDQEEFSSILAALLSICCMLLLGFVDDVVDLRWLYKLLLPTIATLPLLMVYAVNYNLTSVLLPKPFSFTVNLGILYYVYMGMLAVFCTNAINILAGINGLEVGQSMIISLSILIFNIIEMHGDQWKVHLFSFTFILSFTSVGLALLYHNWYPSKVFVGDTYCYFAGMTFAVVGILGHFSKTMMLFFMPQIFNFLFSCPQLFNIVNCPRHRLPKYIPDKNMMTYSTFEFNPDELSWSSKLILNTFKLLNLVKIEKISVNAYRCSNFTLINAALSWFGPINEEKLTIILLSFQIFCSSFAFFIRYFLVRYFYET